MEKKIEFEGKTFYHRAFLPNGSLLYAEKGKIDGNGIASLAQYSKKQNKIIVIYQELPSRVLYNEGKIAICRKQFIEYAKKNKSSVATVEAFLKQDIDISLLSQHNLQEIANNQEHLKIILSNMKDVSPEILETLAKNENILNFFTNKELSLQDLAQNLSTKIEDDFKGSSFDLKELIKKIADKLQQKESLKETIEYLLENNVEKQAIIDGCVLEDRRNQLQKFENAINDKNIKDDTSKKREDWFQDFLSQRRNHWILGSAINFSFGHKLKKYFFSKNNGTKEGNEGDFSVENSLGYSTIVEIKTPETALLEESGRTDIWIPSKELMTGVSQVIHYQQLGVEYSRDRESKRFLINASKLVVISHSNQLDSDEKKKKSFDLYRNSIKDVIIITYDELLANAREMLRKTEEENQK